MRRSRPSTARDTLTTLALLTLVLGAFFMPGCGQAPIDDLLVDGAECGRDAHCQSGFCWQADGEDMKTCKATPPPPPPADE